MTVPLSVWRFSEQCLSEKGQGKLHCPRRVSSPYWVSFLRSQDALGTWPLFEGRTITNVVIVALVALAGNCLVQSYQDTGAVQTINHRFRSSLARSPVQIKRRADERKMAKCLRRVAQLLARAGNFLRKHAQVVGKGEHVLEERRRSEVVFLVVRAGLACKQ